MRARMLDACRDVNVGAVKSELCPRDAAAQVAGTTPQHPDGDGARGSQEVETHFVSQKHTSFQKCAHFVSEVRPHSPAVPLLFFHTASSPVQPPMSVRVRSTVAPQPAARSPPHIAHEPARRARTSPHAAPALAHSHTVILVAQLHTQMDWYMYASNACQTTPL